MDTELIRSDLRVLQSFATEIRNIEWTNQKIMLTTNAVEIILLIAILIVGFKILKKLKEK